MSLTEEQWFKLRETRKIYKEYLKGHVVWPNKNTPYMVELHGKKKVYKPLPYVKSLHGAIGYKAKE